VEGAVIVVATSLFGLAAFLLFIADELHRTRLRAGLPSCWIMLARFTKSGGGEEKVGMLAFLPLLIGLIAVNFLVLVAALVWRVI
tara:strand:- start:223 stop:477 length:255 start_codon:yes stop_codon:yes gene_type:complete